MFTFVRSDALLRCGVAALALVAGAPALAQEAPQPAADDTLAANQDIVVTARKRAERLLDVPIAVTALTGDQLAKQGTVDLSGVQGTIPNVNLVQGRGSTSNANIFIRGVGQPDALQTFDPAVGVYVDGVYMSRIQGALFNLFDVDHVEVLRGPQGTLYGKNTIGGAVSIISRKPDTDQIRAMGSFTYGSYNQVLANGYVSVPLVEDKLALSLAGVYDKRDGTVTDPLTDRKYNDRNTQAGRAILRATPSDRVELILEGDYTHQDTAPTLGYATAPLINVVYNSTFTGVAAVPVVSPAYPYGPYNYKASTSLKPGQGQKLEHWGTSFTANIELSDAFSVTSITGYRKLSPDYYIDFDATQLQVADAFVGVRQHQFSQELQLKYNSDKLKGVFGLYYLDESVRSHQESYDDNYLQMQIAGVNYPLTFQRYIDDRQNTKSYAAFGQFTYDFTEKLSLTAGLRYTKERKRYFRTTTAYLAGAQFGATYEFPNSLPAPYNDLDHVDFDAWTPMATLSYKPTPDTLIYATASRGFKSGGFNGRANSDADVTQNIDGKLVYVPYFKPETVWTYEGGAKGSFLNGRVSLAGDVFYSDYRDFQARVGGGVTGIAGGSFPVVNAGKLRMWGVEAEIAVRPTREWSIRSSFGYLNSKYLEFNDGRRAPSFSCNPTGQQITCKPAFAPPINFSVASDYAIPLGNAGSLTFGGDARFVDKQWLSVDNRQGLMEPGYWLVNAFVQYDAPGGKWYLRGQVKNLTKSIYLTDAQEFSSVGNIQTAYYGDPRTWSGTVGFRF
ncbi:TonB-dependent receptor [Sphingomonas sp. CL5.1]|uniref:TonB-dependent receptor n=1 Tax=Sphingomonas sp. CL5.1 TaxID=2653203 RepID=UPI0020C6FF81|nr:TonB-dependent receptor [Sphingomonas sp. CL5.1]